MQLQTYDIKRSPRGSVVICGDRLVTDELATTRAVVLCTWLNRGIINEKQLEKYL
ncbi:hypothetical protein [Bradyrhizobium sp. USDA 4350]